MLSLFNNPIKAQYARAVEIIAIKIDKTNENCNFKAKGKIIKKAKEGNTINKIL